MKTRKSIQLERALLNKRMQSVLFPEINNENKSKIVPETPGNIAPSRYIKHTTLSVLETPDDSPNLRISNKTIIESTDKPKTSGGIKTNCSLIPQSTKHDISMVDVTPEVILNKSKGIISILESEYASPRPSASRNEENESLSLGRRQNYRKSLAETILPSDLNNEELMSKKLSVINKLSTKRRSIALNLSHENSDNSPRIRNKNPVPLPQTKRRSTLLGLSNIKDMSVDDSCTKGGRINHLTVNISSHSPISDKRKTRTSFRNSDLELTETNGREISIANEEKEQSSQESIQRIQPLNFSTTDEEDDELFFNFKKQKNKNCNISNTSTNTHDNITLNKLSCITNGIKENHSKELSPISDYNAKLMEFDLRPLKRSDSQSEDSLTPTQPASILLLQGVVAYVDVRSGAENRSSVFKEVLTSLGAEIAQKFTSKVTHVIFMDGSKCTYDRAIQRGVTLVSPLWVHACRQKLVRVSESLYPISVGGVNSPLVLGKPCFRRKPKSMQPRNLEEDVLVADQRMKRRKKGLNSTSNSEESVIPARTSSMEHSEDVNSPLFGVAHLLTPPRKLNESASSNSSAMSSDEKEFRTPLATRMFQRLLSSRQNSAESMKDDAHCTNPSPSVNSREEEVLVQRLSPAKIPRKEEVLVQRLPPVNRVRRSSARLAIRNLPGCSLGNNTHNDNSHKVTSNSSSPERGVSSDVRKSSVECSSRSENKENMKSKKSTSTKIVNGISTVCCSDTEHASSSETDACNEHITQRCNKVTASGGGRGTQISQNITSSTSSTESQRAPKKRKLHCVDIVNPSDELIMPSTPPLRSCEPSSKEDPYHDLLANPCFLSQREEMKRIKRRSKDNLQPFPPPRNKKRKLGHNDTPYGSSVSLSATREASPLTSTTPKSRFSLVPRERTSLEEFQIARNETRRRIRIKRSSSINTPLPSICVTSVRSHNLGGIYAIIKSLGGFNITKNVDVNTTHVVCGSERRTLNVMSGISRGCWILDVSWLFESVEILRWAPEEPFELFNFCPGAKISRTLRKSRPESFKATLFSDLGRIWVSESIVPPCYVIQDMLQMCGANICSTLRSADLIISKDKMDTPLQQVTINWVFDSIQFWELKSLKQYAL